jgi:2-haloacid dehalogenase
MMPAMPISAVVFDLGNVLIDWNPRYLFRKLFAGDEEKARWFHANVCTDEWNSSHDLGISYEENANTLIAVFPEYAKEIRAYGERWIETLGGAIEEAVKIFDELRSRRIPCYALTNFSPASFPIARRHFPFLNRFDGYVVSGELGIKKPDPAIYLHMLSKFKLKPEEAFFIDDRLENVQAARALGIRSHHFENAHALRLELRALGLL